MSRRERRFHRQFQALERLVPPLRAPLAHLRRRSWLPVRLPLAILLTIGGLFWFLPVLGLWMLPAGLLLLAVDLPHLRGPISTAIIRSRRATQRWLRRRRRP
ncbi:MAG: hypothetical protein U1E69_02610 [Tabrizicola sp.]|uniref:hypothetical protein n=1 Tax=Tabrizicola sp. TaxID=2005166 RepID=UPI002ABCECC9|nr:hypothetical protein [Tabrizicola sp.]MDZ4085673.1 hypothetical protein [Tabrizicola sp.]